jgi:hypothetical protein
VDEEKVIYLNTHYDNVSNVTSNYIAGAYLVGAVVVVIVWQLDLQLYMQSVPITTNVVSSDPAHGEVYSMQHYVIKIVSYGQTISTTTAPTK